MFSDMIVDNFMMDKENMQRRIAVLDGTFSCVTNVIVDIADELTSGRSNVSPFLENDLQKGIANIDKRLETITVKDSLGKCCICLEDIKEIPSPMKLQCGHVMHANCLFKMYRSSLSPNCPICRRAI
jgi:Ring finger domain